MRAHLRIASSSPQLCQGCVRNQGAGLRRLLLQRCCERGRAQRVQLEHGARAYSQVAQCRVVARLAQQPVVGVAPVALLRRAQVQQLQHLRRGLAHAKAGCLRRKRNERTNSQRFGANVWRALRAYKKWGRGCAGRRAQCTSRPADTPSAREQCIFGAIAMPRAARKVLLLKESK